MSLIRDEDHCCYVIGIFALVSYLSHYYHRSFLVLCICSTVLWAIVRLLLRPHCFVAVGPVHYTYSCIRVTLYELIPIIHYISDRVASQQVFARWKHSVASERWSRHNSVKRRSVEVSIANRPTGNLTRRQAPKGIVDYAGAANSWRTSSYNHKESPSLP